jgi:hypothetical protein
VLVLLVLVWFSGNDKPRTDYENADKAIKGASSPKNDSFVTPWNNYGGRVSAYKNTIWKEGWDQQKHIFTWPDKMNCPDPTGWAHFRPSSKFEADDRGRFREKYKSQFTRLDSWVAPAQFINRSGSQGAGGAGGHADPMMPPVVGGGKGDAKASGFAAVFPQQKWDMEKAPTREEIWLAQEDFWVRREMLRALQEAQNSVMVCQETWFSWLEHGNKRVFRNANWELELHLVKKGGKLTISEDSTIRNINRTRKVQSLASSQSKLGVPFRIFQLAPRTIDGTTVMVPVEGTTFIMRVAGEPQAYDSVTPLKRNYDVEPVELDKPFGIQQLPEWETSPLREVNALLLPYHSHRTITWGYVVNEDLKKLDPEPVEEAPQPATGGGGNTTTPPPGGATTPAAPAGDFTKLNKISRLRYMYRASGGECRHLPIALRVVVDQAYAHTVLAALANSPLRVQITQVTMNAASSHNPTPAHTGGAGGVGGKPPIGGNMYRPPPPPSFGRFGSGSRPGAMPVGEERGDSPYGDKDDSGKGGTKSPVIDDAKLIELTVYGIATLYEAPPEPKKEDTSAGAPK